jgi:hypothetical protein
MVPRTRFTPSEPIPSVDLYNIIHHCYQNKCLVHIPAHTSVCPNPSSYHNSQQVHTMLATNCHHMHSPLSRKVHLCRHKCSNKSQMMGIILQWRPSVTTLLTAVLCILKCLFKIRQISSYHRASIWVSVLCPIPSLRSETAEDSCNIPSCFHMALRSIYSCQHHCDVWNDTSDLLKCYIHLYYFWYHLGSSHLPG